MSSDEVVISVRGLCKTYRLFGHPGDRLKQAVSFGLRKYHKDYMALDGVSFDVRKGEAVGIIGRNGSGKSTLLQLICGILKPTAGSVDLKGRVAALLELGAGFNPEFTGRENVYFQGAMMGISRREMDRRFDGIAEFAGIGDFIDEPVRTYSSGMFMRLAFSVAASMSPDILVVDEALAVGDFAFRAKCYARIRELTESGVTLLFVSHDLETLKLICDRTIYLEDGRAKFVGGSGDACDAFMERESSLSCVASKPLNSLANATLTIDQEDKLAEILSVELSSSGGNPESGIAHGAEMNLAIRYRVGSDLDALTVAMYVRDERNLEIMGTNTRIEGCDILEPRSGDEGTLSFRFQNLLRSGDYSIAVRLAADYAGHHVFPEFREKALVFRSSSGQRWALVSPPVEISHRSHV